MRAFVGVAVAAAVLVLVGAGASARGGKGKKVAARHGEKLDVRGGIEVIPPDGDVGDVVRIDVTGIVRAGEGSSYSVTPDAGGAIAFRLYIPSQLVRPFAFLDTIRVVLVGTRGVNSPFDIGIFDQDGRLLLAHSYAASSTVAPGWRCKVGSSGAKVWFHGETATFKDPAVWRRFDGGDAGQFAVKAVGWEDHGETHCSLSIVRLPAAENP